MILLYLSYSTFHFTKLKTIMKNATSMQTASNPRFTYWQEGDQWLGYLEEFPDYMTQGSSLDDLKDHLLDLYKELQEG